jgi:hypothetical protein
MFNSCDEFKDKIITPNEFINQVSPESEKYSKDSIELEKQFKKQLLARKDFFQNSSYTDSTIVTVDSIIYSSSLNKLSVFILVTNPTSRQLAPNSKHALYFEGTCYLAIRQKDSMLVKWLGPSFSNSYDKNELREIMRDSYFTESANRKPESDCKYNLNDYRFWDCPIWAKLYSK